VTRAFLALGSNLGDRQSHLQAALDFLGATPGLSVRAVSAVYETDPVGGPVQNDFLNAVVEVDTDRTPHELLTVAHAAEAAADRVRTERWGPRTLDVDILWLESGPIEEPDLQVPHPRMYERRFVMVPMMELAPELVPDGWQDHAHGHVAPLGPL